MRHLTIVGYVVGLIIVIASIARWFVIYDDMSQALFGVCIGILILDGTYVYQRLSELTEDLKDVNKNLDGEIKDVNKGIDALNIWVREEFEKRGEIERRDNEKEGIKKDE